MHLSKCLTEFANLKRKLKKSTLALHPVLSADAVLQLLHMLLHTCAFLQNEYKLGHGHWLYLYTALIFAVNFLGKLFALSAVKRRLQRVVETAADLCSPPVRHMHKVGTQAHYTQ